MNPSDDRLASTVVNERLAARVKNTYGEGVDPGISLDEGPGAAVTAPTNDLLKRLETHGLTFSRYRLQGEVARGGMGAILKVWDEDLRRYLAMKVVIGDRELPGKGSAPRIDPRKVGRFLEEAQVTGQLDHPGIVPVHELGLDADGRAYFTMRLVRGRDLKEIITFVHEKEEGWNVTRGVGVILKVCEAMAYAHSKGVIHRDLKPANVMVGNFGEVYVMDWGIARIVGRPDQHDLRLRPDDSPASMSIQTARREEKTSAPDSPLVTMGGDVMGTPCYMSPEQAAGDIDKLGPRSDVYSVGAMLYQLLTGSLPYVPPGVNVTSRTVLAMVLQGEPKPVHALSSDVPAELVAICEKAMARDPSVRYPDTLAMADDLRAYLENRVVKAYKTGAVAELKKWVVRNKGLACASAAALFFLLGGLGSVSFVQAKSKEKIGEALDVAVEKEKQAIKEKERADDNARAVQDALDQVLRLADVKRLDDFKTEAEVLWPAGPSNVATMEKWLNEAKRLAARASIHRRTLATLQASALPYDDETRNKDRQTHPRAAELQALKEQLTETEQALARLRDDGKTETVDGRMTGDLTKSIDALRTRIAGLEKTVLERRTWSFAGTEAQWQYNTLEGLVRGLDEFQSGDRKNGLIKSMESRVEFARTVHLRTIDDVRAKWSEAIASISSEKECPKYKGLRITPQLGLIPIGRDSNSGLWEFAHLQTGTAPERGADGRLVLTEQTGLVFVLIPGGTFEMGSPESEADRKKDEGPVRQVTLDPYFLSKYEMTQGQWERFTGINPSSYKAGLTIGDNSYTLLNPVEQVSYDDCTRVLQRLSLTLPTEAQWEYAARAGTKTPWWTGDDPNQLHDAENLADGFCLHHGGPSEWNYESWDDGQAMHARGDTYRANDFGLHNMHGNVWEWCQDHHGSYELPTKPGTGARKVSGAAERVVRGGNYSSNASSARSASRASSRPEIRDNALGVRPERALTTE